MINGSIEIKYSNHRILLIDLKKANQHCFNTTHEKWKHRTAPEMKRWLKIHTEHIRECHPQANKHNKHHKH